MKTEEHSLSNVSGLRASLEDAVLVHKPSSGRMRWILMNSRTGEHFYSFCSAHSDHEPSCDLCHKGAWAFPVD